MSDPIEAPSGSLENRDAATNAVTGWFLVALALAVLGGMAFAELWIDRLLNGLSGVALLLCGALFLWRARVHRGRGERD
jgi:hypothetical protein